MVVGLFGCFLAFLGVPLGIGGVVFGALGRGKASRGEAGNGGMALAGIITGAVGIVVGILVSILFFGILSGLPGDADYGDPDSNARFNEKI